MKHKQETSWTGHSSRAVCMLSSWTASDTPSVLFPEMLQCAQGRGEEGAPQLLLATMVSPN
jgi:hypothetical protein